MISDVIKLVHLVKERPQIYNFNVKDYHNKEVTSKLWREIAKEMKRPVVKCKKKWFNLRFKYRLCLEEAQKNSVSRKRKKWFLFDEMQFLYDFVSFHQKIGSSTEATESPDLSESVADESEIIMFHDDEEEASQSNESSSLNQSAQMECGVIKLLHLVEERPAIFNFQLKDHTNRELIERLWEEIAREMNLTVTECKNEWSSLRNSYNKCLREGQNLSDFKRKKWYLFDKMQFLYDFVGDDVKVEIITDEISPVTHSIIKHESIDIPDSPINHLEFNQLDGYQSVESSSLNQSVPFEKVIDTLMKFSSRSRRELTREEEREKGESATLTFFRSLVPDMDRLSESRKRKFKQSILNSLYQNLEEQEQEMMMT